MADSHFGDRTGGGRAERDLPVAALTMREAARSLAFWGCLLLSALLFAGTVVAPKLITWRQLSEEHAAQRSLIERLERDLQREERIAAALAREPEYVETMIGIAPAETAVIPDALPPRSDVLPPRAVLPRSAIVEGAVALLNPVATSSAVRAAWLMASAALLILGFTVLSGAPQPRPTRSPRRRRFLRWEWMSGRYDRSRAG